MTLPDARELAALVEFDTPTICNALELVDAGDAQRRLHRAPARLRLSRAARRWSAMRARRRYARSTHPPVRSPSMRRKRDAYYRFVDAGPKPALIVIEDLDGRRGRLRRVLGRGAVGHSSRHGCGGARHQRLDPRPAAVGAGLPGAGRKRRAVACVTRTWRRSTCRSRWRACRCAPATSSTPIATARS